MAGEFDGLRDCVGDVEDAGGVGFGGRREVASRRTWRAVTFGCPDSSVGAVAITSRRNSMRFPGGAARANSIMVSQLNKAQGFDVAEKSGIPDSAAQS